MSGAGEWRQRRELALGRWSTLMTHVRCGEVALVYNCRLSLCFAFRVALKNRQAVRVSSRLSHTQVNDVYDMSMMFTTRNSLDHNGIERGLKRIED